MEYIILAAGVGTRLYPYTKNMPKCLVRITEKETIIGRAVRLIKEFDNQAHITVVVGFEAEKVKETLGSECTFITNPFYSKTNSVASLWFANEVLTKGLPVTIINADIVFDRELAEEITKVPTESLIYYDSSIRSHGDYNVQELNGKMVVMGKELTEYSGEYVGITKFTPSDARLLSSEVEKMVYDDLYDQWYENGLVQMSLMMESSFSVKDVCDYQWSEIDSIDNLLKIRRIIKIEE